MLRLEQRSRVLFLMWTRSVSLFKPSSWDSSYTPFHRSFLLAWVSSVLITVASTCLAINYLSLWPTTLVCGIVYVRFSRYVRGDTPLGTVVRVDSFDRSATIYNSKALLTLFLRRFRSLHTCPWTTFSALLGSTKMRETSLTMPLSQICSSTVYFVDSQILSLSKAPSSFSAWLY